MSDHMADLYAKQFDVWEQVSRRSSLSALALAATSPRYASTPPTFFLMITWTSRLWFCFITQARIGESGHD
jgi:hypothetical protein